LAPETLEIRPNPLKTRITAYNFRKTWSQPKMRKPTPIMAPSIKKNEI